jgi:hypothetical protein
MQTATSGQATTVTLPTDEQILITREFDTPNQLLYGRPLTRTRRRRRTSSSSCASGSRC